MNLISKQITRDSKGSHSFTCHPHTTTPVFTVQCPDAQHHRPLAGTEGWPICVQQVKFYIFSTGKCGNYSDILSLKAARRDSISNLTSFGASNLSCRRTECRFI